MSYDEGRAIHISPESCIGNGDIIGEALTRESAGLVLSLVRDINPRADVLQVYRRQYLIFRNGKGYKDVAGSETSCMYGSLLRGNRETLYLTL